MELTLLTVNEAEELIQNRVNEILNHHDKVNYDKLPGLIEALKIIKDSK